MEKKTIGKFIAVLRKANGMTQKDLGDKLFVSDKTVSRWERDECTPELSLIPAIAEIFGITTDELLRGEKNNPDTLIADEPKPSAKAEKQFKTMLHSRMKRYKNMSLISVGLLLAGLIGATICNTVFNQGLLGFCTASLFITVSAIYQACIASNARIALDEDTEEYSEAIAKANTEVTGIAVAVFHMIILVFSFCLPLTIPKPHFGLTVESWLDLGAKCALIGICITVALHYLIVRPILIKRSLMHVSEELQRYSRKLLLKIGLIGSGIMVLLFITGVVFATVGSLGVAKKVVLNTPEEFKAFMEDQYDVWAERGYLEYTGHTADGPTYERPINVPADYKKKYTSLLDNDGNILCKYYTNAELNFSIEYSEASNDKMPITVITREASRDAMSLHDKIIKGIYSLMIINTVACITIYAYMIFRKKIKK